jgi:pimeloyl-ACP methyl ester carboxylesterase
VEPAAERRVDTGDVVLWSRRRHVGEDTVLLLAGAAMPSRVWEPGLGDALRAAGLSTLEMDWRDTGRSTWRRFREHPYEFDQLVADTVAVLDAWSVERCAVVGYSMGGCVAQLLASEHAELVTRLAFVSSGFASKMQLTPSARQQELFDVLGAQDGSNDERLLRSLVDQWAVLHGGSSEFEPDSWSSRVRDWIAWGYNPRCPHVKLGPQVFGVDRDLALRSIDAPTLVVHGDDDPMFPIDHGRALSETLPRARLVTLPGRGHELFAAPDVHQLIVDHLTRPEVGTS